MLYADTRKDAVMCLYWPPKSWLALKDPVMAKIIHRNIVDTTLISYCIGNLVLTCILTLNCTKCWLSTALVQYYGLK